ncbi:MAG: polysaccharide deacetylase family protein [Gammaproteobacteria bacterium]|nr:polysaccharide deacetylase family protein [Gammaproteobacteria bacterium]
MLASGLRFALQLAAHAERRLSIVTFHRVLPAPDPLLPFEPDVAAFDTQLAWLDSAFRIVPLPEAVARLAAGTLPPRALCLTFDDGYRNNLECALPVLRKYGAPATVFVNTAYLGGGMMWNDQLIEAVRAWPGRTIDLGAQGAGSFEITDDRASVATRVLDALKYLSCDERARLAASLHRSSGSTVNDLMMTPAEVRTMHDAGITIGAHTHSHPILARLDPAAAREEIALNQRLLGDICGTPITCFAYPNGRPGRDYDERHVAILKDLGFEAAVTTAPGTAGRGADPLQLPRFTPWDRSESRYLLRMMQNYFRQPETIGGIPRAA